MHDAPAGRNETAPGWDDMIQNIEDRRDNLPTRFDP